ncbi:MAG: DNRLRE domain-containing protein [Putridiphycobacter sp.]
MRLSNIRFLVLSLLFSSLVSAQVTIDTLQIQNDSLGQDAMVGSAGLKKINFGSNTFMNVFCDNSQTTPIVYRSFLDFDLSYIPTNAIITEAQLILTPKSIDTSQSFSYYVSRVDSTWAHDTINWENQPGFFDSDQITVDATTAMSMSEDQINVTTHVQNMVNYPYNNYGWQLRLTNESLEELSYGLEFYSSNEYDVVESRPKLIVKYVLPVEISTSVTHCTPGNNDGTSLITLSGGSGTYSNYWVYKVNIDPNNPNKQISAGIDYGAITGNTINVQNLDAGLYVVRVTNPDYSGYTNRHFLIGREGETTDAVISHYAYLQQTKIQINLAADPSINDYANTAFGPSTSSLTVGTTGTNSYGGTQTAYNAAGLLDFNMDVSDELEFSKADLHMMSWLYYQAWTSSNEAKYSALTSSWDQYKVTWNSRPEVDTTMKVILPPSSNPNGYTTTTDTISIIQLMEYWQTNPNYGMEIALTYYDYPKTAHRAQRKFNGGSFFKFSFTVKEKLVASYDEEKEEGSITVNAPSGQLPYTYLISYDSIPSLDTLWANLKDSTDIDSAFFFQGKVNSNTFVFDGLEAETYHVAIFDNNGDLVFQGAQSVTPSLQFHENTNITLSAPFELIDSTSSGQGEFFAELPSEKDGGIEFVMEEYGAFNIGLLGLTDSLTSSDTIYKYGISLDSYGKGVVYFDHVLVDSFTVPVGGTIGLGKEDDKYYLDINNVRVSESSIQNTENLKLGVSIEPNSGATIAAFKVVKSLVKGKPFYLSVEPLDCNASETDANVTLTAPPPIYVYTNFNISVKNILTQQVVYTGTTNNVTIQLPVGVYKATYSYSYSSPIYSSQPYTGSSEFVVGYPVNWLYDNPTSNITETPLNTITPTDLNYSATAIAENITSNNTDWWYNYNVGWGKSTVPVYRIVKINMDNANGTAISMTIEPLGTNLISKQVIINNNVYFIHNTKPLLIAEIQGAIHVINNDLEIIQPFQNTITGPLAINTEISGKISLTNNMVSFCSPDFNVVNNGFYRLTRTLDGGYYQVNNDELLFEVDETYTLQSGTYLNYKIYNSSMQVVAGVTDNGTNVIGGAPLKNIIIGQNGFDLDLSQLTIPSGYYILEVMNLKGEKVFMKFKID